MKGTANGCLFMCVYLSSSVQLHHAFLPVGSYRFIFF
jgi:hypothetical protein